jgi:class 3 adenylate cyclase/predicted ATPase
MSLVTLEGWLAALGLAHYAEAFAAQGVDDLAGLRLLTDADLQQLGVLLGHRRKILRALEPDLAAAAPAAAPVTETAPATPPRNDSERRQLTVLFCDMVGFTEIAARIDPELLQRVVRRYEDACAASISRYEGFLFQRLGDGVVAFFGYPMAHENEAERAVRAALDIVATMAALEVPELPGGGRLGVRIGIASGVVVVSALEKSAVGETMNLAARLQATARPGEITVSSAVQRLAGGSFEYEPLGRIALKGIAAPVPAFRVAGLGTASSRFEAATRHGLSSLVGREQEIGLLLERWALARDGDGQVVLLAGEPGIGKSRILGALRQRLEAQGARTMRLQCSPYYLNSAYWPSIDNFERTLKFTRDEPAESRLDKLEALLVGQYGLPRADMGYVASMMSIPAEARYGALPVTPQRLKAETLRTLVDITEAAARQQPRVMLFEDLHWADPTTLEVLDLLIERVRAMPLLIVLTHRPEFAPTWGRHAHVTSLNLSKLTRAQSSALVATLAGGKALPAELHERILAKTDGVPLYLEELTRAILESGELRVAGDHFDYAGSARNVTIPATLRDSLMARLDRFAPVKEIAQIGAAIGRDFSHELIRAIAPHTPEALEAALQQLAESGLAFRRGEPPHATYTFKHALLRDAAYDSLLKSRRQALHARIAQVLADDFPSTIATEPELLAQHLTAAGENAQALRYWQLAGKRAIQRLAHKEAVSHLSRGMALIETVPHSAERDALELDLRTPLGTASLALNGWQAPEVWSSLHPALALARGLGRDDALVPIYWGLWVYVLTQGRIDEALGWVDQMLEAAEAHAHADLQLMGHRAACVTHFYRGAFAESVHHGERVLALYDPERHRYLADLVNTDARTAVGNFMAPALWMLGRADQAVQACADNDAHARRRAHPFDLGYALAWGGEVFDLRGEPERLLERVAEAERLGRSHNLPFISEVLAQLMKGLAWLRAGRTEEGIAQLRGAIERWCANGALALMPYFRATLAEGLADRGDAPGAMALIDESLAQIARPGWGERAHHAEVLRIRGRVLERLGRAGEAEASYRESIEVARTQGALAWVLRSATSLATLWHAAGRTREAIALLQPAFDAHEEGRDTRDLQAAAALLEAMHRD